MKSRVLRQGIVVILPARQLLSTPACSAAPRLLPPGLFLPQGAAAATCQQSTCTTAATTTNTAAVPDSDKPHPPLRSRSSTRARPPAAPAVSPLPRGLATPFLEPRIILSGPPQSHFCSPRPYSILPRLSSRASRTSRNLKSRGLYSLAAAALIVLASWAIAGPRTVPAPPSDKATMSLKAAPPGHVGNLTPEQEQKLRRLWNSIFKLCGVADAAPNGTASPDAQPPPKAAADESESPQKKRFGIFRWKNNESQSSASALSPGADDADDDNDKHGQTKQFHKTVASQSPEAIRETIWAMVKNDHPDALALRFLRARKWDVDKALVMLVSAMNWRHSDMNVDSDIMRNGEAGAIDDEKNGTREAKKLASDFMAQSRMGKSFLHGTDKEGRPICVVRVRLHKPGAQSAESLERYTVFIIETARLVLEPPVDTATIIFDMTGFSLANMDYHPVKFMIQCFEANYPESLGAILVHNAPWVFQGIWRIIRGWLDPVVAAKVHFTNYRAGLEEFIEPSHIIKELEGDEDWEYKYEEPAQGENDMMKDTETRDRLLKTRAELYKEFEAATRAWIGSPDSEPGTAAKEQRARIAEQLKAGYWRLDPYVRSRSLYDRRGNLLPGGSVNWYNKKGAATQANGNGVEASGENGA